MRKYEYMWVYVDTDQDPAEAFTRLAGRDGFRFIGLDRSIYKAGSDEPSTLVGIKYLFEREYEEAEEISTTSVEWKIVTDNGGRTLNILTNTGDIVARDVSSNVAEEMVSRHNHSIRNPQWLPNHPTPSV